MTDAGTTASTLGPRFVEALAVKDAAALGAVLHPQIDLPRPDAEPLLGGPYRDRVLEIVFGAWFGPDAVLDELVW